MKLKAITTITAAIFLGGCASTPTEAPRPKLPDWVMNPTVENGFADTQCVRNSADMSILKNKAVALARAEIAKQIDLQVKAMDKTYQNLTDTHQGSSSGSTFESVSKQITSQKLSGSRAIKVDYVDSPDGTLQLCAMVALNPQLTEALYKDVVSASGRQLSPQNEAVLFQEFKAHKAQQELEVELSKSNGG